MRDDDIVKLLRPAYDITREAWRRRGEEAAKEIERLRASAQERQQSVRLEARKPDGGPWIEIYPFQLQWMAKEGNDVRAIEVSPYTTKDKP